MRANLGSRSPENRGSTMRKIYSFTQYSEGCIRANLTYARLNDRMAWILKEMNHWPGQKTAVETLKLMAGFLVLPEQYQGN